MIPSHFRTIREWVHERMEPGQLALGVIDRVCDRLNVLPDVLIDPARIEDVVKIRETVTEREVECRES